MEQDILLKIWGATCRGTCKDPRLSISRIFALQATDWVEYTFAMALDGPCTTRRSARIFALRTCTGAAARPTWARPPRTRIYFVQTKRVYDSANLWPYWSTDYSRTMPDAMWSRVRRDGYFGLYNSPRGCRRVLLRTQRIFPAVVEAFNLKNPHVGAWKSRNIWRISPTMGHLSQRGRSSCSTCPDAFTQV